MAFIVFWCSARLEDSAGRGFLCLSSHQLVSAGASFRIAARNLLPLLDSGTKRNIADRRAGRTRAADGAKSGNSITNRVCEYSDFSRTAGEMKQNRRAFGRLSRGSRSMNSRSLLEGM